MRLVVDVEPLRAPGPRRFGGGADQAGAEAGAALGGVDEAVLELRRVNRMRRRVRGGR